MIATTRRLRAGKHRRQNTYFSKLQLNSKTEMVFERKFTVIDITDRRNKHQITKLLNLIQFFLLKHKSKPEIGRHRRSNSFFSQNEN